MKQLLTNKQPIKFYVSMAITIQILAFGSMACLDRDPQPFKANMPEHVQSLEVNTSEYYEFLRTNLFEDPELFEENLDQWAHATNIDSQEQEERLQVKQLILNSQNSPSELDLDLNSRTHLTSLPEGVNIKGNLYLDGCYQLKQLPRQLHVNGCISVDGCESLAQPLHHKLEQQLCEKAQFSDPNNHEFYLGKGYLSLHIGNHYFLRKSNQSISRGAFGKVFVGRKMTPTTDTNHSLYAIKELIKKSNNSTYVATNDKMFQQEIELMPLLGWPIEASASHSKKYYIVMELMDANLKEVILSSYGDIPIGFYTSLLSAIAPQLHHLHNNNVVHTDLHAGNILLNSQGNIKISDIGLARKINTYEYSAKSSELLKSYDVLILGYTLASLLSQNNHFCEEDDNYFLHKNHSIPMRPGTIDWPYIEGQKTTNNSCSEYFTWLRDYELEQWGKENINNQKPILTELILSMLDTSDSHNIISTEEIIEHLNNFPYAKKAAENTMAFLNKYFEQHAESRQKTVEELNNPPKSVMDSMELFIKL